MNQKLNILYLSNLYPPHIVGGAETIAAHLAEEMAIRGHTVTVLSTQGPCAGKDPTVETRCGVTVIRFFPQNLYWLFDRGQPPAWQRTLWHLRDAWNPSTRRQLEQLFGHTRPDIVHTHNIDGFSPIVWHVARRHGLPVVHTAHDYHLLCPRATLLRRNGKTCAQACGSCRLYRVWYRHRSRDVDVFVSPSRFLLDCHQAQGLRAQDYRVIPYGIPVPVVTNNIGPRNQNTGPVQFLYLGQLSPHKGVGHLLAAFHSLPADLPVLLHVAGRGPLEPEVRRAAATDNRVRFHGFVEARAKAELLAQSDVLVMPSIWFENYPLAVLEAYQAGVTVLASDIGGLPEMVEVHATGQLLPPGNTEALVARIVALARDPTLVRRLQHAARDRARRYTVQTMADEYQALYVGLLRPGCHRSRER